MYNRLTWNTVSQNVATLRLKSIYVIFNKVFKVNLFEVDYINEFWRSLKNPWITQKEVNVCLLISLVPLSYPWTSLFILILCGVNGLCYSFGCLKRGQKRLKLATETCKGFLVHYCILRNWLSIKVTSILKLCVF